VKATVTGTSATVSGLAACSAHSYTVTAYNANGESAKSAAVSASTTGCTGGGGAMAAAPYLYPGWGDPPAPSTVMGATGIKWFTMAFVLSSGGCTPAWDGSRPLTGGTDQQAINAIRSAGGDVVVSFGGASGNKLGNACKDEKALAAAYQKVIDTYKLKAIDIDLEAGEVSQSNKVLKALKIVKQKNAGISTILTLGTGKNGLEGDEAGIPAPTHKALVQVVKQVERREVEPSPSLVDRVWELAGRQPLAVTAGR
jgi:hypothetical protein